MNARFLAVFCILIVSACGSPEPGETPESAVTGFLDAMDRSAWDSRARREAFDLIDEASRRQLEARARRVGSLGRGGIEPWEMFAQGTFRLRWTIRSLHVDGDEVSVLGVGGERATIPVREEDGLWRVVLFTTESAEEQEPAEAPASSEVAEPPLD